MRIMAGMSQNQMQASAESMALKNPVTLATYERYTDAQRAVDYLSDEQFPVQNCMIVGTDLRQMERVTGRLTQQKAALGGLLSGAWFGLFIGLILSMFDSQTLRTVITTMLFGALFGLVWALITYAMTRGRRDFTSVTTVVATRYEVLVEHGLLARAREVLAGLPNNGLATNSPQPTTTPVQPADAAATVRVPTQPSNSPQPSNTTGPSSGTESSSATDQPQVTTPSHGATAHDTVPPTQQIPQAQQTPTAHQAPAPDADQTQVIEQRPPWERP